MGGVSAIFLLTLALSGLLLNHAERLGLHGKSVRLRFIMERYNMQTADSIRSLQLDQDIFISELQGSVFVNSRLLENTAGRLLGVFAGDDLHAAVLDSGILLITATGELVELLPMEQLPFDRINGLGESPEGDAVLLSESSNWMPDPDWLAFEAYDGPVVVNPPDWTGLGREASTALLEAYNGRGPTLYRVLLDLHSGRLFGWGGRTVMDLTAVAIVLLVLSGLRGWWERSRGPTRRAR